MKITAPRVEVDASTGRARLSANVLYDDRPGHSETYWFDVPLEYKDDISRSGNPWLAAFLPLAVHRGESISIEAPVDVRLLAGCFELMEAWSAWYPHLRPVAIHAPITSGTDTARPGQRTAAFFSGGVDSMYTVLRQEDDVRNSPLPAVDDLLTVWGFDIPLTNVEAFGRMRQDFEQAAGLLKKEIIFISTNLRDKSLSWRRAPWGALSHGGALAAVSLLMERRYQRVLIGASREYTDLSPNGSHPVTDPFFSTSHTAIVHDGTSANRVQKIESIAQHPVARKHLRVCWESKTDVNCCRCSKCYRTMATLDLLGVLSEYEKFDASAYDSRVLRSLDSSRELYRTRMRQIISLAEERGRPDVARDIQIGLSRSSRPSRLKRNRYYRRLLQLVDRS